MDNEKLVDDIFESISNKLINYGNETYVLIFRNAEVNDNYTEYVNKDDNKWKIIIAGEWVNRIGIEKPMRELTKKIKEKIGNREKLIHTIKIVSLDFMLLKDLLIVVEKSKNTFPFNLKGITIPNIHFIEGKLFYLCQN